MAANTNPIFTLVPKLPAVRFSAANTGRDGTGTLGALFTAGSEGAFFKGIRFQAEGTTTAGVIRIFVQAAGAGNFELIREILVSAVTPSTTLEAWSAEWWPAAGLVLGAGDVVKVGTHNAETFAAWLLGGGNY